MTTLLEVLKESSQQEKGELMKKQELEQARQEEDDVKSE